MAVILSWVAAVWILLIYFYSSTPTFGANYRSRLNAEILFQLFNSSKLNRPSVACSFQQIAVYLMCVF